MPHDEPKAGRYRPPMVARLWHWRCVAAALPGGRDGRAATADPCAPAHLVWMCDEAASRHHVWPADKTGRWLGFVQGVLATRHGAVPDHAACPLFAPPEGWREHEAVAARAPIADAARTMLRRCLEKAEAARQGPRGIDQRVVTACEQALAASAGLTEADLGLRLGFIQGVLTAHGLLDVAEEREVSRPVFHAAWHQVGIDPPPPAAPAGEPPSAPPGRPRALARLSREMDLSLAAQRIRRTRAL